MAVLSSCQQEVKASQLFSILFSLLHRSFRLFAATLLTLRVNSCPLSSSLITFRPNSSDLFSTQLIITEAERHRFTRAFSAPRSAVSPLRLTPKHHRNRLAGAANKELWCSNSSAILRPRVAEHQKITDAAAARRNFGKAPYTCKACFNNN